MHREGVGGEALGTTVPSIRVQKWGSLGVELKGGGGKEAASISVVKVETPKRSPHRPSPPSVFRLCF